MQFRLNRPALCRHLLVGAISLICLACSSESRISDTEDAGYERDAVLNDVGYKEMDGGVTDMAAEDPVTRLVFSKTTVGEFGGPIIAFHSRDGDQELILEPDGHAWFRPFDECHGRHRLLTGVVANADILFMLAGQVKLSEDLRMRTCEGCVHCGYERLKLISPHLERTLIATPTFEPAVDCIGSPVSEMQFSPIVVDLVGHFEEASDDALEIFKPAEVDAIRLGVFHINEWRRGYRPPSIDWTLPEVSLLEVLGDATPEDLSREVILTGMQAKLAWSLCESGEASWPADLTGLDANSCDARQVFFARENEVDYLVACEPVVGF